MEIPIQLFKFKFCKIRPKTKKPYETDWTKKPYTYDEILKHIKTSNGNYGVLCGYENLAVIDSDHESLELVIENMLPKTFTTQTGGGGKHYYFIIKDLKEKIILETIGEDEKEIHLGEVQSHGTQVVGPGSIHPNGKEYKIINQDEVVEISYQKLLDAIKPMLKATKEIEQQAEYEHHKTGVDDLSITDIWGLTGLKNNKKEYYGPHPVHGSESTGVNFWINPLKNTWHCFRHQSGGGPLSAIAVKEGIIDCSDSKRGFLRGSKALQAIDLAKEKYGLKIEETVTEKEQPAKEKPKEVQDYEILWLKDLRNYVEKEKEWIIEKIIPTKAVCILTGKRGTLKTFITLFMTYAIASGKPFLDKFNTSKGKVIYLDKENGINIMKKRTKMLESGQNIAENDLDIGFICFSQIKLDKLGGITAIEQVIEEHKPKLLIVDTYRRSVGFDENDAGKVSELFVDTLRPIVEKHDVSILMIHHNRKSGPGESRDEMDEMRGSSDLANYADIILKLERRGGNIVLKQLKNRNAQEEKPIKIKCEFSENSDSYVKMSYDGEFVKQSKVDKCVEMILIWIAANNVKQFKRKTAMDHICLKKGISESTFKDALNEMINIGKITRAPIGVGLYNVIE